MNLLKLLKAGAIFCSERYPEDAEAIDREIGRQLNEAETGGQVNATAVSNTRTIEVVQCDNQNTTITITVAEAINCTNAATNEANANGNASENGSGNASGNGNNGDI